MLTCFYCPNTKKQMKGFASQAKGSKWQWRRKVKQIDVEEVIDRKSKQMSIFEDEEWVAEPENGVLITLVSQADGGNFIKKIQFSEDRFNTLEAQKWWSDNYDKLIDLYSICLPPISPYQSDEDDQEEINCIQVHNPSTCANSNDQSNAKGRQIIAEDAVEEHNSPPIFLKGVKGRKVVKWVVEDEPGVYVTIRSLPHNIKEIVRVELSQEKFGEVNARMWWDENKARLLEQYL